MNEPIEYRLIDGKFSAPEAREILLDMLNKKIQFHQLKNFSSEERFGKSIAHSLKRIEELENDKVDVLNKIEIAMLGQYELRIKASIVVEFCEQPELV